MMISSTGETVKIIIMCPREILKTLLSNFKLEDDKKIVIFQFSVNSVFQ
jgi:hypothetical protein